jgi:uncharacterized protein (TIGR04255 family)
MAFPGVARVVYGRNPLAEVICQLRFPAILKIEAEPPAALQELVRNKFPHLEIQQPAIPEELPPQVAQLIAPRLASYNFLSDAKSTKISLTRDFIAVSTLEYRNWETFSADLEYAKLAFERTYSPSFYSRIGLRYRNAIVPKRLLGKEQRLSSLIVPQVLGPLGMPELDEASVLSSHGESVLALSEHDGKVRLRYGLGTALRR